MKKKVFEYIYKSCLILIFGILLGFTALCLVHLLPTENMYRNVAASKDVINSHAEMVAGYTSTAVDNFTDSIMLNEAICDIDTGLIDRVINNYQVNYWKGYDQQENLMRYLDGEEGYRYQGYSHYWGGHQVFIKLLLLVGDYSDILILNTILQLILVAVIIIKLQKMGRGYMALPFCITIASMMPIAIALCLQFCTVYYVTLLGCLVIMERYKKMPQTNICYIFLGIGMATSYVDFLTYPFVSLGIPLVIWLALDEESNIRKKIIRTIWNSAFWCMGYVGMWAGKWLLGSILLPESGSLTVALESIAYRGSNNSTDGMITLFDVIMKNAYTYLRKPILLVVICAVVYYLYKICRNSKLKIASVKNVIPFAIVVFYPFIWYKIAENHSYEHAFMAYRELAIGLFAGLSLLATLSYLHTNEEGKM